ncbi:MAG TPA: Holliday junction branch migration protein RuvA [Bacteroidales bacterium]|nr:Holliday junction branch migration protein RuvA [Bacteroidales bacterium]
MFDYIKGKVVELNPTEVVIETNNFGYRILISLQTFSQLTPDTECKLYLYHHIREDTELLYGFFDKEERYIFSLLINVTGVGPNTAKLMLSSLSTEELRNAIISDDINKIKSVKGIGLKTAQKIIIDLKDKIIKGTPSGKSGGIPVSPVSQIREEASSALVLLGFPKQNVEKVIDSILKENPNQKLETLIKEALKRV